MFFLKFLFIYFSFASNDSFFDYETPVEVPEPLYIDLVRGLHSHQGEWEVNSLFSQKQQTSYGDLYWAPEIEWVFGKKTAIELELPMQGSDLKSYKFALQTRTFKSDNRSTLHGLQVLYEVDKKFYTSSLTTYFILAHRFNYYFSLVTLSGFRTRLEKFEGLEPLVNLTTFYNYSEEIDFGIEFNYSGEVFNQKLNQVVPQMHVALKDGMKIQFGFGTQQNDSTWAPIANLRLIKEFNKKNRTPLSTPKTF
jgi:hypothetical protein